MNKNDVKGQGRWKVTSILMLFFAQSFFLSGPVYAAKATLNAKEQDIRALIETVARITGRTIIIDPRVKNQKVTILSQELMDEDEIYAVFLSALRVHNIAAIETDGVTKIVQDQSAKGDSAPVTTGSAKGYDGDQMVTTIVKVHNTDAQQLAAVLRTLVPQQAHFNVYRPTNVLIIHDRAANIKRINKIIQQVDKASNEDIEIINLQHAAAGEVVRILENLVKKVASKKNASAQSGPRFVADERTNSILLTGGSNTRLKLRSIISHLDTPLESSGNTKVIFLKNAKASELVQVLTGVVESIDSGDSKKGKSSSRRRTSSRGGNKDFNIEAHEDTNSLVITATPDVMRSVESVIRQLDIRRHQVHVEAIIVELSEDMTRNLGVNWLFGGDGGAPAGVIQFSGSPSIGQTASAVAREDETLLATVLSGVQGVAAGIGRISENQNFSFAALISALAADTNSNVLSTPSLMTLDNEEASISVGEELPIITGSTLGSNNSNPFSQVSRQDVGIKLKVTPQINGGDAVRLQIEQEVSGQSGATDVDITIQQRKISTTVMVDDGSTIVLGGLIDDVVNESEQKIPLLGDIPLIGHLFRNKGTTKRKTNLMVFIRPTIIKDASTLNNISSQKYDYMRALHLDKQQQGINLMWGEESPVLPELDDSLTLPPTYEDVMENSQMEEQEDGESESVQLGTADSDDAEDFD